MSNWISVDDKMPDEVGNYLVTDGEDVLVANYALDFFSKVPTDDRAVHEWDPTHWQPLPNPPPS